MNIAQLKNEIIAQPELIETILEKIGFVKIKNYGIEYRCAKDIESNPTGISVKKDTLSAYVRSSQKDISGDIFTLVQKFKDLTFPEAIKFVCVAIGKTYADYNKDEDVVLPFGGYYKGLKSKVGDTYKPLDTYPEDVLECFANIPSKRFYEDGISLESQAYYEVMYDELTDRIVLPWRNAIGQIIGIMGRYNDSADYCHENNIPKWFPIIPFSKKQALFGFFENYHSISESKTVYVGESEKFPMQLRSMEIFPYIDSRGCKRINGINMGVAVGTHSISEYQKTLIQSCYPERIIVCFDEGLNIEDVEKEAKKLKFQTKFIQCKVGFVFDKENKYLPKGSKASPSDFGAEIFKRLVCECVIWV